jgi:cholesterol oxidase
MSDTDVDWLVIGSGFGGSVAALRLAQKGYRVAVMERGRRYRDEDLPSSAWQARRFIWAPQLGLRGIMRNTPFRHVFSSAQTGVGGGSLVYGGVLFRAQPRFYDDPQWARLGPWEQRLADHYATAERMLGARPVPFDSPALELTRRLGRHFGAEDTFDRAPVGVFFGAPGVTVDDPYFGGEGPPRTGCTRCGNCLIGCRTGAANTLTKNYLWFAEKLGVEIHAEREVIDVRPIGAADGSEGYRVTTRRPGSPWRRDRRTHTALGVVFAGGTTATNMLLANCKHGGSLPHISDRLGSVVRTNSEAVMAVQFPEDRGTWRDVAASSRVIVDGDTQLEFLTYGPNADMMGLFFTALTGPGSHPTRVLKWLAGALRHPRRLISTLWPRGWSRRSLLMLVMQPRDNAIAFEARKRRIGRGYRLRTRVDRDRPAPTHLSAAHKAARWVARETGGIAHSSIFEALGNQPMTAHVLGGAAVGANPQEGVVDEQLCVFGYRNLVVCDAAALPANPGVNPALTITALAEHGMAHVPPTQEEPTT